MKAYAEAVKTVDPVKAVGKLHTLWIAFARFYEANEDLSSARVIFDQATQVLRYRIPAALSLHFDSAPTCRCRSVAWRILRLCGVKVRRWNFELNAMMLH